MSDVALLSEPSPNVISGVLEARWCEGFDAGYRRAAHDLLAGLVYHSETFLARQRDRIDVNNADSDALRRVLYRFVQQLESEIERNARNAGFVEGGLGI